MHRCSFYVVVGDATVWYIFRMNKRSFKLKDFTWFFWVNVVFVSFAAGTLIYVALLLPEYSDSPQVSAFVTQLRSVRIPINTVLLAWLIVAVIRSSSLSVVLAVGTAFQWIVLMDDYLVIGLHRFDFDSLIASGFQALRPLTALSLSYITLSVFMYERGRRG